jgi:hypothetical protein
MLSESPFYHSSIRTILIAFGRLFTDLQFERKDSDGNVVQLIKVPVAPGSREKWIARIQEDPNLSGKTQITLPRIGFELDGFQYDASRKLQTMTQFSGNLSGKLDEITTAYSPVPYTLSFKLYVVSKTQGDALQIVEQILPFFTPGYTVTVEMFPEVGINQDIPFVLQGVSMEDSYDGPFETKRTVTYILEFVAKAELLGPAKTGGNTILHTRVKLGSSMDTLSEMHSWDATESGDVTNNGWSELL